MISFLLNWVLSAIGLWLIAFYMPGIFLADFNTAIIVIAVFSLINLIVKPVVSLLALPLNILTLGLVSFLINALMFALGAWLVAGFEVSGFLPALIGSIVLGLISGLVGQLTAANLKGR